MSTEEQSIVEKVESSFYKKYQELIDIYIDGKEYEFNCDTWGGRKWSTIVKECKNTSIKKLKKAQIDISQDDINDIVEDLVNSICLNYSKAYIADAGKIWKNKIELPQDIEIEKNDNQLQTSDNSNKSSEYIWFDFNVNDIQRWVLNEALLNNWARCIVNKAAAINTNTANTNLVPLKGELLEVLADKIVNNIKYKFSDIIDRKEAGQTISKKKNEEPYVGLIQKYKIVKPEDASNVIITEPINSKHIRYCRNEYKKRISQIKSLINDYKNLVIEKISIEITTYVNNKLNDENDISYKNLAKTAEEIMQMKFTDPPVLGVLDPEQMAEDSSKQIRTDKIDNFDTVISDNIIKAAKEKLSDVMMTSATQLERALENIREGDEKLTTAINIILDNMLSNSIKILDDCKKKMSDSSDKLIRQITNDEIKRVTLIVRTRLKDEQNKAQKKIEKNKAIADAKAKAVKAKALGKINALAGK